MPPPVIEPRTHAATVRFGGAVVAETTSAVLVREGARPAPAYIPRDDVEMRFLEPSGRTTLCEWKGRAAYFDVKVGDRVARDAAWTYEEPTPGHEAIRGHIAFYPALMDECVLDGRTVRGERDAYYGGWDTGPA